MRDARLRDAGRNKKKTANNLTVNMRTLEIQSEGTD